MKTAETEVIFDRASHIGALEKCVMDRGLKGSELVKAFAMYRALENLDTSKKEDLKRLDSATAEAKRQWLKLTPAERVNILGGWHATVEFPTVKAHLAALANIIGPEVRWALTATECHDGRVEFHSDWEVVEGTFQVFVKIVQGTPKDEGLRQLRNILGTLEAKWDEAIRLDGHQCLTAETVEKRYAVGDLVVDQGSDNERGIIIGGFTGRNGTVYAYLTPDGHVDMQYASGLRGTRGGFPPVTDLEGNDPLANQRVGMLAKFPRVEKAGVSA